MTVDGLRELIPRLAIGTGVTAVAAWATVRVEPGLVSCLHVSPLIHGLATRDLAIIRRVG